MAVSPGRVWPVRCSGPGGVPGDELRLHQDRFGRSSSLAPDAAQQQVYGSVADLRRRKTHGGQGWGEELREREVTETHDDGVLGAPQPPFTQRTVQPERAVA